MSPEQPSSLIRRWLILGAIALTCAFTGCASGTLARDAKASGALVPKDGKGRVAVYRTPGLMGSGTKLYLFANGQLVGPMKRGTFYTVDGAPGPVGLSFNYRPEKMTAAEWAGTAVLTGGVGVLTAAVTQSSAMRKRGNITVNLRPNDVEYVRIDGFDLTPMSAAEGQAEMDDCHWLVRVAE
jgi:hypothetical protein